MLDRPAIGAPCNGCGLCCLREVCGAGAFTQRLTKEYGQRVKGPCPALRQDGDTISCGMVVRPKDFAWGKGSAEDLRAAARLLIGAEAGCDEWDTDDPNASQKLQDIQDRYIAKNGEKITAAVKLWYGIK